MKKQELSLLVKVRCSSTNKKGMAKTSVLVKLNDETECFLGFIMPKDHWDETTKKCKEDHPDHQFINKLIDDKLEELKAHFLVLSKTKENVTAEDVKSAFKGIQEKETETSDQAVSQQRSLLAVADEFISEFTDLVDGGQRSKGRLKHWRTNRKVIEEFAAYYYKKGDILFDEIGPTFGNDLYVYLTTKRQSFFEVIEEFGVYHITQDELLLNELRAKLDKKPYTFLINQTPDFFMKNIHKKKTTNLSEVTAKKRIKDIKQLINIGVDKGLISQNPAKKFSTTGGEKEVLPLELYDIQKIFTKTITIERLDEVRDMYIFQCFTGFAYSDLYNLTADNLYYVGIEREPWLIKERGKTSVNEMVPLLPIAIKIIEKYKDHPYCKATGRLLPIDSNSNYNGYLKEIAAICGVNRNLTTHLARHTFADLMLNVCNIPLEDVSKMMGHKSIRTTMQYCRVRKERISRNMKTALQLMFDKSGRLKLNDVA
ncbi:MAG: site-specific integrase [Flavobacteriia bacterium]|nr:site-specific integrase [Flavobacteriia bacterium]OJX36570.1 MAG: hypothetical protein BGO87_12240 [Flavobacteriia bacterium 40-80]